MIKFKFRVDEGPESDKKQATFKATDLQSIEGSVEKFHKVLLN